MRFENLNPNKDLTGVNFGQNIKNLFSNNLISDKYSFLKIINHPYLTIKKFTFNDFFTLSAIDSINTNLFIFNHTYLTTSIQITASCTTLIYLLYFVNKVLKITLFLNIIYTIFFITNFENYIKQINYSNAIAKFFILNESEKEVGPVDDFIIFVILFILTLLSFIFISIFFLIIQTKIFTWILGSLLLVSFLILTVPVNLLLDFGVSFFVYIRGSASSTNYLKECIFDLISTTTIFIRFVVQNIRFLFIFLAIFELLEWIFSVNSNLFVLSAYESILNTTVSDYFSSSKNLNILIVNFILFIFLYFYYTLHLLFLLLVQITVYIGISVWLFFFLYSSRFMSKNEKFFIYKKLLNN